MNLVGDLHFIRPWWLAALPLAVLLPWAWRSLRRAAGDWSRVCDAHLLEWLSVGPGGRPSRLGPRLAAAMLALAAIALAGPSWERLPDGAFSSRQARVIALDLSQSMLAGDLRPDRLTLARYRIADILEATEEGQVGLVAYAGNAFVVSPLTSDMNTIVNLLPALEPSVMPAAGSRGDRALELAASLLRRAGVPRGEILLVTDSATDADAARARALRDDGMVTSVLAVGTPEGAPIPSGGGFVTDRSGNVVVTRVDLARLEAVAEAGGGRFSRLDLAQATEAPWRYEDASEFALREDGLGERWRDMGPWLVLLLLPFAMLGFRRGVLFALPLTLLPALLAPVPARAAGIDDAFLTPDQQAWRALRDERPEAAAAVAEDPMLAGEAWFRAGDHARAARAYAGADTADGHYNRGNALAHLGDLDGAIAAYDEALRRDPDHEDARANRELLEQAREQQREQEQQEQDASGDSGESDAGEQDESQEPQGEGEESEQDSEGEGSQDPQQSESEAQGEAEGEPGQEQMAQNWTEEDAQAMEQWLRRIPDDPGGLLRRKFRNQHQRMGAPDDESEPW